MRIKLLDYSNKKITVDIGKKENVATIDITVMSGDEIANVTYKDYSRAIFDSSNDRIMDYFDDSYRVYDFQKTDNLIDNPKWLQRKSSYDDRWKAEGE